MNFIDISSHQAGINLDMVFAQNPIDGLVIKATQNTNYVNTPYCDKWVQWCIAHDKPWGFYHFLDPGDPVAQAKYFVKHCTNYFHDGIPIADFEADAVQYGAGFLKNFLDTVYNETGVKPMVYCNLSTIQASVNGFRSIANAGYPLWLAQWASMGEQYGFLEHPWQSGSYEPFKKITMHQYSGHGRLNGYSGDLDLDIFYGSRADWDALAGKNAEPTPTPEPSDDRTAKIINLLEQIIDLLR